MQMVGNKQSEHNNRRLGHMLTENDISSELAAAIFDSTAQGRRARLALTGQHPTSRGRRSRPPSTSSLHAAVVIRLAPGLTVEAVCELLRCAARATVLVLGDVAPAAAAAAAAVATAAVATVAFAVLSASAFGLGCAASEACVLGGEDEAASLGTVPVAGARSRAAAAVATAAAISTAVLVAYC